MPELTISTTDNEMGTILDFRRDRVTLSWTTLRTPIDQVDIGKYRGVFIYDTRDNSLTKQIDYIDPIQGKIAGTAEEELSYKTPYDPAVYTTGEAPAVVDSGGYWGEKYVGKLWWDLSTIKFHNPYQGDIIYQTANWGRLFTGASADIYELSLIHI